MTDRDYLALLALQRQGVPWLVPDFLRGQYQEMFGPDVAAPAVETTSGGDS